MTLLYNSNSAAPRSAVVATVGFADSVAPTQVRALVRVGADTLNFGTAETTYFAGNSFWNGKRRRIAPRLNLNGKTTGRYVWQLEVTPITGGVVGSTSTFRGTTLVVNQANNPVGNGWQIAGIDRIYWAGSPPSDSSILIVEGDGTAKLFTKAGLGWQPPKGDFTRLSVSGDTILRRHKNGIVQYFRPAVTGIVKAVSPIGTSARYHWSQVSGTWRVDSLFDEAGVRTRLFYTSGMLDSIRAPDISGIKVLKITHNGTNISTITDPDHVTTGFQYFASGLMKERSHRASQPVISFEYDSSYTLRSMIGPVIHRYGSVRSNGFGDGITSGTSALPAAAGDSTMDNFFANTRADTTRFIVNAVGQPLRVVKPSGSVTNIYRSSAHFQPDSVWSVGPKGLPDDTFSKAQYDPASGDLLKTISRWKTVQNTDGTWQLDSATTVYAYDSVFHHVTKITQPDGIIREIFYTGPFRDSIRVAGTKLAWFEYYGRDDVSQDSSFWMAGKFDGAGDTPGTFGQLKSVRERGHGAPLTYIYGQFGNLQAVETPGQRVRNKGEKTSYLYDATGVRVSGVVSPAGDSTTYTYDDIGRVKVRSTVGRATRPPILAPSATWIERLVRRDSIAYDDLNLVTTYVTQSPNGSRVSKVYRDGMGNITKECPYTAVGTSVPCDQYFYEHGLVSYQTMRNGARHDFKYDGDGRVVQKVVSSPAQFGLQAPDSRTFGVDTLTFTYGESGIVMAESRAAVVMREYRGSRLYREIQSVGDLLASVQYPGGNHELMFQYTYDKLGRVTKRELGRPERVKCAPDTYCETTRFLIAGSDTVVSVSYHYDALGRLDSLHWGGLPRRGALSFAQRGFDFAYDSASRWIGTTSTVQSGFTGSPYVLSQSHGEDDDVSALSWNGDSRLAAYDTVDSPNWVDELRRDAVGRPRRRVNRDGDIRLYYDGLGQLVLAGNEWFKYDSVGAGQLMRGRYQGTYAYNTKGQVETRTTSDVVTYSYDPAGNRLAEDKSSSGSLVDVKFAYNALDQQVSRRAYDAVTGGTGKISAYWYDALGRRVLESDSTPGKSGRVKRYYYEATGPGAGEIIVEQHNWQDTPNLFKPTIRSSTGQTIYLRGPMGPNHLLMRFPDEDLVSEIFVHQDRQFSMLAESAPDGRPLNASSTYRAFGERIGALSESGMGYSGAKESAGDLLFLRNRYYDPNSGTFTQEDPIGIAGGMNLYQYAANDPINFTDPFGLCPLPLALLDGPFPVADVVVAGICLTEAAIALNALSKSLTSALPNKSAEEPRGAKSQEELERHLEGRARAKEELAKEKDKLGKAKGPKQKEPIKKKIEQLEKDIKGHEKEIRQKWGSEVIDGVTW